MLNDKTLLPCLTRVVFLGMLACNRNVEPGMKIRATPPVANRVQRRGIDAFDTIVTTTFVFSDSKQRQLYEELPRSTEAEKRAYSFSLRAQPGMVPSRHFHLVAVTISPLPKVPQDAGIALTGTAGPNGGFVGAKSATRDGAFEVTVSVGASLPNTVSVPELDPHDLAVRIAAAYDARN